MEKKDLQSPMLPEKDQTEHGEIHRPEEPIVLNGIIAMVFDILQNFENQHPKIAGCLYCLGLSVFLAVLIATKETYFVNLPYLELLFVPTLITFCVNFKLISLSNIQPYITSELNWKLKYAGISLILSLVFFIAGTKETGRTTASFFYLSIWPVSLILEHYIYGKSIQSEQLIPFMLLFMGSAVGTEALFHESSMKGIGYAIVGGLCLNFSGDCLKRLGKENLFTILHVVGLLIIIFLPLFFPIEGLLQPGLREWMFFIVIAICLHLILPVFIRIFAVEQTGIALALFNFTIPAYYLISSILQGTRPSTTQIFGNLVLTASTIMLIQVQAKCEQNQSVPLQRRCVDPPMKDTIELQTLQNLD